jgi:hypoxanthine phosphoribosyltransferase
MKKIYETWNNFDNTITIITNYIKNNDLKFDYIYGLPRGGLCLAVKLSHKLNIPILIDYKEEIKDIDKNILIVDDISDTGNTLLEFRKKCLCNIHIITWHINFEKTCLVPDFYVKIVTDWVVYPWEND